MARQVSITLGKGSTIALHDEAIYVEHEESGTKEWLCPATKSGISQVQEFLERMKIFVPD